MHRENEKLPSCSRSLKNTRKYTTRLVKEENGGIVSPNMRVSLRNNIREKRRKCDCSGIADVYDTQDKICREREEIVV